jgi:hypothetical protein
MSCVDLDFYVSVVLRLAPVDRRSTHLVAMKSTGHGKAAGPRSWLKCWGFGSIASAQSLTCLSHPGPEAVAHWVGHRKPCYTTRHSRRDMSFLLLSSIKVTHIDKRKLDIVLVATNMRLFG